MLFIITFILATASLFAYLFAKSFINPNRSFAKLAITLTSLISFLLIIVCISTIILSVKYTNEIKLSDEVKSSQNIVNIKDNRDTEGGFFIGCGEINAKQYYYYYYKTDSDSYKVNKINVDDCEIIYTKGTPHIDTIVKTADKKATENLLTLTPNLSLRISTAGEKYKIYIPEGSITTDFSIDME